MERSERKFRNERGSPPNNNYYRGYSNNPPMEPKRLKGIWRPGSTEFVVPWQMNDKQDEKKPIG